ncbi:hypothetical protein LEP1GSC082_3093 [Leptospira kirschneri str. H2]|uniref:Uncharacterized protein n=2 Tax=Leptospira kirschneri TaxID=29507 RepID=A0A0E2B3Z5_9LEPT|nr:hypothetical protein LEP1GSC081_3700 [Leptospira kirschneri str. H1]EKO62068.1 hypothetical protein LEP1GSC082_3093 [Leptospira kirschneri str. H2]EMK25135.1 hypothetical protein LEP1GSC008_2831 [Leptospira kirschneri serovar Bulgarica str. Nikolaevo]
MQKSDRMMIFYSSSDNFQSLTGKIHTICESSHSIFFTKKLT